MTDFTFLGSKITVNGDCSQEIKRCLFLGRKARQHIKKQRYHFANKGPYSQSDGFSSSHVWMWELDHKESWEPKNWCFQIVVLEKTLESPLDSKEINQSVLKEINPEYSVEGLMRKLKLQYFGHLMWRAESRERLWCRKNWGQEEEEMTEDETVGWHHQHSGHEFEQAPGVGDRQGSRTCCSQWVAKSQTQLREWTNKQSSACEKQNSWTPTCKNKKKLIQTDLLLFTNIQWTTDLNIRCKTTKLL